jgi:hypothetical protein
MKTIQRLSLISFLVRAHAGSIPHSSWTATPAFVAPSARQTAQTGAIRHEGATSLSLFSTIDRPDTERMSNDTVQHLRDELKSCLLNAADDFRATTTKSGAIACEAREVDGSDKVSGKGYDRWYVIRLINKIVRKISRSKKGAQSRGVLSSDSFRQSRLDVGAYGNKVIELAEQLSLLNPTPIPTLGFKHYGGASPSESKLGGAWKLRFTTAADASFPETEKRGVVTTSQVIDAEEGTLTNVIDFEKGKLKGFRVEVEGEPTSGTNIGLTFRSVKILRKSRFPRLFGEITVRLPSRLIRWFASRNKAEDDRKMGPYLQLRYVDDTLRMHTTDSGNWFIQTRI